MLGNWSLGDYFKEQQIRWFFEFLTQKIGLPKEKLFATVFEGSKDAPRDEDSINIWQELFNTNIIITKKTLPLKINTIMLLIRLS